MAKLNCKCGHKTRMPGNSVNEFLLLSHPILEKLEDRIDANSIKTDEMHTFLLENTQETSRCEKCKRLYIYDVENGELVVRVYNLEETLRDEKEEETKKG